MTQRIFDVDNPQDVKDLFDILPDDVKKVRWHPDDTVGILDKNGPTTATDLIRIAWRDKTEITRPVDKSKWIGCLCWFWGDEKERAVLGELAKIYGPGYLYYKKNNATTVGYEHCRPVRRDEIKFVEDVE